MSPSESVAAPGTEQPTSPLLRLEELVVHFGSGRGATVQAVSGVTLEVRAGETLGLVGESGCGKSTTAKAIMRLVKPTSGRVIFAGEEIQGLSPKKLRPLRPQFQMISQDPLSAVNPLRKVHSILEEPLRLWRQETKESWGGEISEMLDAVGLDPGVVSERRPHELSGGQLQRVCIARALMLRPKLLVADEPIASLDVSIQAQILNLLLDSRERFGLTLLLIAHDLAAVRAVSDRVAIMYLGKLCEVGPVGAVYDTPAHPYTAALLAAVPRLSACGTVESTPLPGDVPSPLDPPSGCRFRTRCPAATERCAAEEPRLRAVDNFRSVACHYDLLSGRERP